MRVLVWNLFHGRADPPAGRPLLHEFAAALAGWEWDVALLQEVPPWWPSRLADRCAADWRCAWTSRNQLVPLRRAVASRKPDLLKSNGGGANAILVRAPWSITAHGRRRLRIHPERRVVHAVRVERLDRAHDPRPQVRRPSRVDDGGGFDGAWIGNVHAQLGHWNDPNGMAAPLADLRRATAQIEAWSRVRLPRRGPHAAAERGTDTGTAAVPSSPGTADLAAPPPSVTGARDVPILLGGDFNLPRDAVTASLPAGWSRIASSGPDHVAGRRIGATGPSRGPDRGTLSDHAPLLVEVEVA